MQFASLFLIKVDSRWFSKASLGHMKVVLIFEFKLIQ